MRALCFPESLPAGRNPCSAPDHRVRLCPALLLLALAVPAALAQCPGEEPVASTIPAVQGAAGRSLCEGRVVSVTGVVTASFAGLSGFFLQDPAGDGDPSTSDGIFVFTGSGRDLPSPGSVAQVTGRVAEFARSGEEGSVTELDVRPSAGPLVKTEVLGAAAVPAPVPYDPPLDDPAYGEAREGMLVAYPAAAVVEPANSFGEYFALRYDRLPPRVRPTPREPGIGTPVLIDRSGGAVRRDLKVFDLVPPLTAVLHFDFGNFRLEPLAPYIPDDGGWTPNPVPAPAPYLSIASVNCQRLLRRGTSPAETERKLAKTARAIRDMLRSPDLVAVQEVEDLALLAELAARAGDYQAVLLAGCDFSGINVGLLYRPGRMRVTGSAQLQREAPEFRKPACTLPDGRVFQDPLLDRPSLRIDLRVDDAPFTIVVNHWRSQIGGRDEQRLATADFLAGELKPLAAGNLIVLGDFNDAEDSEALLRLASGVGLVSLTPAIRPEQRYSLIFEGRSQAFDHILISPALARRVAAVGYAHYNADFPAAPHAADAATPLRAADHDPPFLHLAR